MIQSKHIQSKPLEGRAGIPEYKKPGRPLAWAKQIYITDRGVIWDWWLQQTMPTFLVNGTLNVWIYEDATGKRKKMKVHRLVAHMYIPNPYDLKGIEWINGDRTDNRKTNLRRVAHVNQHVFQPLCEVKKENHS